MLPARRGGSCRAADSRGTSRSESAIMVFVGKASRRHDANLARHFLKCLNRAVKRKPVKPLFSRHFTGQTRRIRPSWPAAGEPAPQPHDVADDFGDRVIMLDRDFVVDLDRGI